jgi:hypothetical protein
MKSPPARSRTIAKRSPGGRCRRAAFVFIDRCGFELKAVDILGERQFGYGQLVLDRARLLLGDLGLEQVAREALWFMLTFERRGEDFVPRVWLRQPEGRLRRSSSRKA